MATTYEAIAEVIVGSGGASTVSFTSIPSTYKDLEVKFSTRTSGSSGFSVNLKATFNGATSRYYEELLYNAAGSVASTFKSDADPYLNWTILGQNDGTSTWASGKFYIPDYRSGIGKAIYTQYVSEDNTTSPWTMINAALWNPVTNAAITSMTFTPFSGTTIVEHSSFYLYGIKNS